MPINGININPDTNGIYAAYRPIILSVYASRTDNQPVPPVVYCDIYFNGVYYKTISKTSWEKVYVDVSLWQFDIQNACQEYLKSKLPAFNGTVIEVSHSAFTKCFCRFRSSGYDISGFVTTENTAPVQGTSTSYPANGTGTQSNTFTILNAILQNEDLQQLKPRLDLLKHGSWNENAVPLTMRPKYYYMDRNCSDHFPAFLNSIVRKIKLFFKYIGQNTFHSREVEVNAGCAVAISIPKFIKTSSGYSVTWDVLLGTAASFKISVNGGVAISVSINSHNLGDLPTGIHSVSVTPVCEGGIDGISVGSEIEVLPAYLNDPGDTSGGGPGGSECMPLFIASGTPIPNGAVGHEYYRDIRLESNYTGLIPFTLSNIIKPTWMNMEATYAFWGSAVVRLTGTPTATADDVEVSFTASNCHESDLEFNQLIDIIDTGACTSAITDIVYEKSIADRLTWTATGSPTKYFLKHVLPDGTIWVEDLTVTTKGYFLGLKKDEVVTIWPVCVVGGAEAKGTPMSITIPD
ncbi:hypothetical protein ACLOAU_14635 [Niabella sp. CJ426]|uniref:hypothetical protein n=1 Tax=Niabella sp. CJ426 TaxID=3393740 RepID=UPI003D06D6BA